MGLCNGSEQSGYICGRRAGPKPTTSIAGQWVYVQLGSENEMFNRQTEAAMRHLESLEKENIDMVLRLQT